jgi:hypothetical protein
MKRIGFFLLFWAGLTAYAGAAVSTRGGRGQGAPAPGGGAPGGGGAPVVSARAASTTKVVQAGGGKISGTKAFEIDGDACKEEYWGCMDQFCVNENENGARCECSNDIIKLNKEYKEIVGAAEAEIDRASAIEVQIEFGGEVKRTTNHEPRDTDKPECGDDKDIACKVGAAKYNAAAKLCETQVSAECKSAYSFAKLQYAQNVRTDCGAYQAMIKDAREKGAAAAAAARKQMRETASATFDAGNKWNESECRVELRACMSGPDACGADWAKCGGRDIGDFKNRCEKKILDNCQAVRDKVWDGFAEEIAPTLSKLALDTENEGRQNCLSRISNCLVNACKDNIDGKGGETMDGCLSRPEMVKSFCKIELDECDPHGLMWTFTKQKLAAMRVDRCTEEVKECLSNDSACGAGFGKCLGLDLNAIHDICPVDKLVVCKQAKPDFSLSDVDNIVMGLFLQIDNKQLDDCQNILYEKMTEVCGSAFNCDKFTDENMGARGLKLSESDGTQIISGIVNWGAVNVSDGSDWAACASAGKKDCSAFAKSGTVMVEDYAVGTKNVSANAAPETAALVGGSDDDAIAEVKSVAGEINRIVGMIEGDQKLDWCINGRDMSQISGKRGQKTDARFPLLMQVPRRVIAEAGITRAVANHNKKMMELVNQAQNKTKGKAAQYMCYSKPLAIVGRSAPKPTGGGGGIGGGFGSSVKIIGKANASDAEIVALAGTYETKVNEFLTKEVTAVWIPDSETCRLCFVDHFKGKRKFVEPMVNDAKGLKRDADEYNKKTKEQKKAALIAGGATAFVLSGAGGVALLSAPVLPILAIGALVYGAVNSVKYADPGEADWEEKVDYCIEEHLGWDE